MYLQIAASVVNKTPTLNIHRVELIWIVDQQNKMQKETAHVQIWTEDLGITSAALYQLSYASWYVKGCSTLWILRQKPHNIQKIRVYPAGPIKK